MSMMTVAFMGAQGGHGRSALTVALARHLIGDDRPPVNVLVIDLDPTSGASRGLLGRERYGRDVEADGRLTALDVLGGGRENRTLTDPASVIMSVSRSRTGRLDLVPARSDLESLARCRKRSPLAYFIARMRDHYGVILLDCPPDASWQVDEAYRASDCVVIPASPGPTQHLGAYGEWLTGAPHRLHVTTPAVRILINNPRAGSVHPVGFDRRVRSTARRFGWTVFAHEFPHSRAIQTSVTAPDAVTPPRVRAALDELVAQTTEAYRRRLTDRQESFPELPDQIPWVGVESMRTPDGQARSTRKRTGRKTEGEQTGEEKQSRPVQLTKPESLSFQMHRFLETEAGPEWEVAEFVAISCRERRVDTVTMRMSIEMNASGFQAVIDATEDCVPGSPDQDAAIERFNNIDLALAVVMRKAGYAARRYFGPESLILRFKKDLPDLTAVRREVEWLTDFDLGWIGYLDRKVREIRTEAAAAPASEVPCRPETMPDPASAAPCRVGRCSD